MKPTASPKEPKKPAEPRIEYRETIYSETALALMEKATGQRYSRPAPKAKAPTPPAED